MVVVENEDDDLVLRCGRCGLPDAVAVDVVVCVVVVEVDSGHEEGTAVLIACSRICRLVALRRCSLSS